MEHTENGGVLGRTEASSILIDAGKIAWMGPCDAAPTAQKMIDATGLIAMPGLVDCHTHTVWGGSRADEFRQRLSGTPYSEILERGGGILSTVRHTRATTDAALLDATVARFRRFVSHGVTTVEVKSGYGLTPDHERRMLTIALAAGARVGIRVMTTFLGAHAVPLEFRGNREAYVDHVIHDQIPNVAGVADFIDVYVDRGAFTLDEGRRILRAGRDAGLKLRIHAEQVDYTGAAEMAAEEGALSADHLEQIDAAGIAAMAENGTTAVLLPGAMLYLKDPPPPVNQLRQAGVPMAIATDYNPGSSPVDDIWVCATLACVQMGLTVEEALLGMTKHAASALGRSDLGVLQVGGPADIALFAPPAGEALDLTPFVHQLSGVQAKHVVCNGTVIL